MKIVYFGNTLNRHQVYVADELYSLTNGNFVYVETVAPTIVNLSNGGKAKINRNYVLESYKCSDYYSEALQLARSADVALFGADSLSYEIERMKLNRNGIAFEVSERFLKRGWFNLLSPHVLKRMWYYHMHRWSKKPIFKLCASAYGAIDQYKLFSFKNRCYKWGYFTKVEDIDINRIITERTLLKTNSTGLSKRSIHMMWCSRFLSWKHPELAIMLANRLKMNDYSFKLDMFGEGQQLETMKSLSSKLNLNDVINFCGNVSNDEVLAAMRLHDIFLFTSDSREGWGAVLNEAMSNGCVPIASDAIGAVPYLINNGINGLSFKSLDLDSLYDNVVYLIENPNICSKLAIAAYHSMKEIWSPQNAARNFLKLCQDLVTGEDQNSILVGPCSKALP
jgi:glycosyltransferase involved in cell wall biosynthesis